MYFSLGSNSHYELFAYKDIGCCLLAYLCLLHDLILCPLLIPEYNNYLMDY